MFTEKDLAQIEKRGISMNEIDRQMKLFRKGIDFVKLVKPAVPEDGIVELGEKQLEELAERYETGMEERSSVKFVPASGAASRMFKDLFSVMDEIAEKGDEIEGDKPEITNFFHKLGEYPFFEDLKTVIEQEGEKIDELIIRGKYGTILEFLLTEKGINYGSLPKGLLKFHRYSYGTRTAMEEHYEEASLYLTDSKAMVNLHFTVSSEHLTLFSTLAGILNDKYKNEQGLIFNTSFSVQKPATDTIAVDMDNNPFRQGNDELLFRPGGHGALLENLDDLDEYLVFIGNIDNVCPDAGKDLKVKYKKALAGFLIKKTDAIHAVLDRIENGEKGETLKHHIHDMLMEISPETAGDLKLLPDDLLYERAYRILNRPLRVCGMVKNVGEPGGGPFWVENEAGKISKQIIESSQVNMNDEEQKKIFSSSTHFNPVDIVCYIKDHNKRKFNLTEFTDPSMAFITKKTSEGKELKALEHPGLWNGSMANWLTWFVDVPLETFSPVKTVFDFLRPEHQSVQR